MTLSGLFTWTYHGQDALALRDYQDDEQAFTAVKQFFMAIDGTSVILLLISLVVPIAVCCFYHWGFNKKPGRHYRPVFQLLFFLIAAFATISLSWILEIVLISLPPVDNNFGVFLFDVSLGAMCVGMLVYIVAALIIGLSGRTNAYPLHKIFSKR